MSAIGQEASAKIPSGTVTFLFTDIVKSTQHWEKHPRRMSRSLVVHDELLASAAKSHNGYVFKHVGDSLCIAFQTAIEALSAAVAGQQALNSTDQIEVGSFKVRMALHSGECYESDGDYFGPAVNRVSRLMAVAYGGQIVVSQAVFTLLRDQLAADIRFRDLGLHKLRDLGIPERIYQVLSTDLDHEFPPLKSLDYYPNNLPAQMTAFIGRENVLSEVLNSLESTRLLTLTGPGGTGKSRLALQAAAEVLERYDDGVFFVPLEAVTDPKLVGQTIVSTLGVDMDCFNDPLDALKDHLRTRRMLLILDNFEHVLDAAGITGALLSEAPLLRIMTTSREPLHVYGEREFLVPALETQTSDGKHSVDSILQSEAVTLFIDRIRGVKHDFAVSPEIAADLAAICNQLDGLPLAIELAAARVKMFSIPVLRERLQGSLRLLDGGPRDAPYRHRTLQRAIAWSYNLLDEDEAKMFRWWSVFRGGATLHAAESVCTDYGDGSSYEIVSSLLDKNLLLATNDDASEPRFTMSSTIRSFARAQLVHNNEFEQARRRHLNYFLTLSQAAAAHLSSGEYAAHWDKTLTDDLDNIRAVLSWSLESEDASATDQESGILLAGCLHYYWYLRSLLYEGRRWLGLALLKSKAHSHARGTILNGLGLLAWQQGDYEVADAYLMEAVALFRELEEKARLADSLHWYGHLTFDQKKYLMARELFAESLSMYKELGARREQEILNKDVGLVAYHEGDYLAARLRFEECLAHYLEQGNIDAAADVLLPLGDLARLAGDLDGASAQYERSLSLFQEIEINLGLASCYHKLGQVAISRGDVTEARINLRKSLAIQQEVGNKQGVAECLAAFASFVRLEGERRLAVHIYSGTDDFLSSLGAPLAPADRVDMERDIEALKMELGEIQFNRYWTEGERYSVDELTEIARTNLCE